MEPTPQIINTSTPLPNQPGWKKKVPFLFIGILVFVIAAEVIWGIRLLTTAPLSSADNSPPIIDSVVPQIIVNPTSNQVQVGDIVPVDIKVVTAGNPTDSVDVIIRYDASKLEASGSGFFKLGVIYPEYPVAEFDNKQGLVQISATTPVNHPGFSGIGILATLNFRAKAAGVTSVEIDFVKSSTADTNLVMSGSNQDLLEQVVNADINISQNPASVSPNEASSCEGFFQYCRLGDKTGKQFCQSGIFQNNVCSFDPDLTVSCSECQLQ